MHHGIMFQLQVTPKRQAKATDQSTCVSGDHPFALYLSLKAFTAIEQVSVLP